MSDQDSPVNDHKDDNSPAENNDKGSDGGSPPTRTIKREKRSSRSSSRSKSRSPPRKHRHRRSRSPRSSRKRRERSRSGSPVEYRRRGGGGYRGGGGGGGFSDRRDRSRSPMSSRRRHIGSREEPPPNRCIGVFGLSLYTTERDLKEYFGKYGPIEEVQLVYDHPTGRSRGFGFLYFENLEDAVEAKERAAGVEIDGHRVRVDFSVTKRAHTPTPGIYMGKSGGRRGRYYDDGPSYRRSPSPSYRGGGGGGRRSRSYSYSPRGGGGGGGGYY